MMTQTLRVVQAFDRTLVAEVAADDGDALENKLVAAAEAMRNRDGWLRPHQRSAVLQRAASLLEVRQEPFVTLIAREGGKPASDAAVEVIRAIDGLRNAAEALRTFAGREIPMGLTPASERRWAFTTKEPIGVVAAISAFNHPLNLIVHQVAPAIAVGCPVIVKPAAATPLSCLELVKLLREAGLDEAWCQTFITDDNALAERLATDSRIAFLSFIGSARVGWHLHSRLSPGTRCALEHGGAAPVIVDRSANLDTVIEPIVKGGYYHAGQVCVSTQRIFVHQDIIGGFVERLTARVGRLRVGDPLLRETEVGPLIDPRETSTRRVVARGSDIARGTPVWRRPILGDDADAGRPGGAASRCQGVSTGDLWPGDLCLRISGARSRDRHRERAAVCVPGQHLLDRHRACASGR